MDRKSINCSRLLKKILTFPAKAPYKVFNYLRILADGYFQMRPAFTKNLDKKFLSDLNIKGEEAIDAFLPFGTLTGSSGKAWDTDNIRSAIKTLPAKQKDLVIESADKACSHIFDLLGSGNVGVSLDLKAAGFEGISYEMPISNEEKIKIREKLKLKTGAGYEPINWHIDFRSGFRWDAGKWHKKITFGNKPGADIKIPWELSRCYHFLSMGQAYLITGNEKYAGEFVNQTSDWINGNLPYKGVNWVCAMEAAIRLCNWLLAFAMLKDSKVLNRDFKREFAKSAYMHANYLRNNLENKPFMVKTNHYISDIAGLAYAGVFFGAFDFGKKLVDFSVKELKKEMDRQVYSDGCSFEASTCYHKLVLELFFYATIMITGARKTGLNDKKTGILNAAEEIFGKDYINKLKKMFEFIKSAVKPNGELPQIGDNDSGRLHVFDGSNSRDARFLLNAGAVFFEEPSFKINEFAPFDNCIWIFGETGKALIDRLKGISFTDTGSRLFKDAGWGVSKGSMGQVFVSAGPNGQGGDGGHSHNDKLSFDYIYNGEDIITDTGTYTYTAVPELRNKYRSTRAHNTVIIDGLEQNLMEEEKLFFLEDRSKARIKCMQISDEFDFIEAAHYGYSLPDVKPGAKIKVIHNRQFLFLKRENSLLLKDTLSGEGKHCAVAVFHAGRCIDLKINEKGEVYFFNKHRENILKICCFGNAVPVIKIGCFPLSEGYGIKSDSSMLEYSFNINLPAEYYFVICRPEIKYSFEEIISLFMKAGKDCQVKY